ncbi:MAG: hypothetical protein ACRC5G_03255 [Cetobacterium sp.]
MDEIARIERIEAIAKRVAENCRLHLEHKNLNTLALVVSVVEDAKEEFSKLEVLD